MVRLSKRWMMVSAFGHGVMFALGFSGLVRFGFWLCGSPLSQRSAGNLFLAGSLVAGSIAVSAYSRYSKRAEVRSMP